MTDTAKDAGTLTAARARIAQSYEMMFPKPLDTSTHAIEEAAEIPRPQWSGTKAFLLGWLLPSTTAQRTQELSLRRAWLVHLAAVLIAPIVIFLAIFYSRFDGPLNPVNFIGVFLPDYIEIADDFRRHPFEMTFATLGIAAVVEVEIALLALVLTVWGARDEPFRKSYRNAIRQVWIRSAHIIPAAILISSVAGPLSRMDRDWNRGYSVQAPVRPTRPQNAAQGTQAMKDYRAEFKIYRNERNAWRQQRESSKPLYLLASPVLIGFTVVSVVTWFLWAMLRGIGAPRQGTRTERPPICEDCGYNLRTIPEESRCPECARPVLASIGPDARPGPIWLNRQTEGTFASWMRCAASSIRRPTEFGMQIRLGNQRFDHRRFWAMHLPPIFLTAFTAMIYTFIALEKPATRGEEMPFFILIALLVSCLCCVGTLGVTLLGGTIVGLFHTIREKRNLLPGAMQAASYLTAFLMLWAMFGALWFSGIASLTNVRFFQDLQDRWGVSQIVAMQFVCIGPNVAIGCWYLTLLSRATAATRYANK